MSDQIEIPDLKARHEIGVVIQDGPGQGYPDGILITPNERDALIEVAEAAQHYARHAPFPVYVDIPSEQAGRRLEAALAKFKDPT